MGIMGQIAIARQINKFHPNRSNHLHLEHALRPTNQPQRLDFYNFIRNQMQINPNFIECVLFSDEAKVSNLLQLHDSLKFIECVSSTYQAIKKHNLSTKIIGIFLTLTFLYI